MLRTWIGLLIVTAIGLLAACELPPRDQIRVVGSSTVYPFTSVAAEQFARATGFKTPIIEATGTGGGMKLFCGGLGEKYPDIVNASRRMKDKERKRCEENGVTDIFEIPIGFDGIVLGQMRDSESFPLTRKQLFLALAKKLPEDAESGQGALIDNPYQRWSDIDAALPDIKIEIYGPPPTSGTRDAFVELVMEEVCIDLPAFQAAYPDKKQRKLACHQLREDGGFIDAGENDNIIVQKLQNNEKALGIFGYSFLEENRSRMQGLTIEGVEPTFESIASGDYAISRSLFLYAKMQHLMMVPGLTRFLQEVTAESTVGEDGYLAFRGLIPRKLDERTSVREALDVQLSDFNK